jgi:hypothetical protein
MLTPARLDEAVERVVRVVAGGLDALVLEEDDVLRVGSVSDARDVARRIVEVGEVLDDLLILREGGRSRGDERRDAAG